MLKWLKNKIRNWLEVDHNNPEWVEPWLLEGLSFDQWKENFLTKGEKVWWINREGIIQIEDFPSQDLQIHE